MILHQKRFSNRLKLKHLRVLIPGCQNKTGVRTTFFFKLDKCSAISFKRLGESFPLMWLNIGLPWKITEMCVFWFFFNIDLCSTISFKRFLREFSIDVTGHAEILKKKYVRKLCCFIAFDGCFAFKERALETVQKFYNLDAILAQRINDVYRVTSSNPF